MYDIPKFLKRNKNSLIYNDVGELIFYIPEIYFERKFATVIGENVSLMGIFNYTKTNSKGINTGLKTFNFPTIFLCKPSSIDKQKNIKLTKYSKNEDYRLLKFKKGNIVVVSTKVPQNVENAELFYKMFTTGKLPTTIPYDKLHEYFIENIKLNGASYGLSIQMFGILISEICRNSKDKKKLFRHSKFNSMTDYQYTSIKNIPKLISPFTSITSENWDQSVVNAIVNKNIKYSPLEKLFTL